MPDEGGFYGHGAWHPFTGAGTGTGSIMGPSGPDHAAGLAPDPGPIAGTTKYLREDATWALPPGGGAGTGLSSVGLTMPSEFRVANSPLTQDGTLAVSTILEPPHFVWAGPVSQAAAAGYWNSGDWDANSWIDDPSGAGYASPVFRLLEPADLPLLKASGSGHAAGIAPDPGATAGSVRFLCEDATWQVPSGTGTGLTSVGLTMPAEFTVANSPLTANGTIAVTKAAQNANLIYAGPATGSAQPTFRTLTSTDIPALAYVTSVGLAMPGDFTVANSPVTGANTLTVARVSQTAAQFLASPAAASGVPSYRRLTASDYPAFGGCGAAHAQGAVPDPGSVAGTTRFLREDGYWAQYAGGSIAVWDANVSLWG
jgi:hypothetical protein